MTKNLTNLPKQKRTSQQSPKILILSDIHIGSLSNSEGFGKTGAFSEDYYDKVAERIHSSLVGKDLIPNLILVPGDLTSRGTPEEFSQCGILVRKISEKFGIEKGRALITYGNHDVDWRVGSIEEDSGQKRDLYCKLAALSGSLFAPGPPPCIMGPEVANGLYKFEDLSVIVLNSGIECYPHEGKSGHEYHHGKLNKKQLEWFENFSSNAIRRDRPCLVMIHHHLTNIKYPLPIADISTLEEGAEVIAKFGSIGVDLVVHGHRHHPALYTEIQTGWKNPVTFFCAGSFGVNGAHRADGKIPNTFHYIEFGERSAKGNFSGSLWTFEQLMDESWTLLKNGSPNLSVDGHQSFGEASTGTDIESALEEIIKPLISSNQTPYMKMPDYRGLNLKLKCVRLDQLNRSASAIAKKYGYELTGNYPEKCILTPIDS